MSRALKYAFRITHIDNICHIEENGIVKADSLLYDPNYISIGDNNVIGIRASRDVKGYRLSEYIPFYLGPRSPMLYVIQHGYNGVKRVAPEQIVYCILRLADIITSEIECIFTNGHALSVLTAFYGKDQLGNIDSIINYDDVYSSRWDSTTDLDLKRRKEAELLVKTDLEPKFICGYVVYNLEAKQKLESFGIAEKKIIIKPNFYF